MSLATRAMPWRHRLLCGALAAIGSLGGASAYEPALGDFNFNRAVYNHFTKHHLSAAVTALQLESEDASDDHRLFIVDNLLSYGLHDLARQRFDALRESLSAAQRETLWLKFARYQLQRGYFDAAETTLTEMRLDLGPRRGRTERAILLSQVQLHDGRSAEAVETLLDGRTYTKNDFARYNLAMALMGNGEIRRARIELDRLGRDIVTDPLQHALRDRANLTLAYNYLAEAKGASALPILRRIRVEGPFSDEALLGMGWAEISSDKADDIRLIDSETDDTIGGMVGAILRPGRVDDDIRSRLGMNRVASSGESEETRFRRALLPWLELDGRDPKNPAVLEVQLAIPYALDALGETDRARQFYERAVERLEAGRVGLDKAMDGIRSGRMIETMIRRERDLEAGWNWRLRDLPDAPETYYLANALADSQFQEALKNYRDLQQLQRKFAAKRARLKDGGPQQASVPPTELFRQKLADQPPVMGEVRARLKLDTQLKRYPRNETLEGLLAWTYRFAPKIALKLSGQPGYFQSQPPQDVDSLITRMDALLDGVNTIIGTQRKLLEDIGVAELEQHKAMLTRYLIDARFALARLYDQTQLGDDAP